MHVSCKEPEHQILATFVGSEVALLVNYLKMWRNTAPIGEWLAVLEPLLPSEQDDSHEEIVTTLEEPEDETQNEQEMQAEAFRELGGVIEPEYVEEDFRPSSDDEITLAMIKPMFPKHSAADLQKNCKNCGKQYWRHTSRDHCVMESQVMATVFEPEEDAEEDSADGAVFVRIVGEGE